MMKNKKVLLSLSNYRRGNKKGKNNLWGKIIK